MSTTPKWAAGVLLVVLLGTGLAALIGRYLRPQADGRDRPAAPRLSSTWMAHIDVDVSASTQAFRRKLTGVLDILIMSVIPRGTQIVLWAFAQDVAQPWTGQPKRARDIWDVIDKYLANSAPGRGTYPDHMLRQNLADIRARPQANHVIVLCWDGECTGTDLTPIVQQLAAEPQLRAVWVVGVTSSIENPNCNFRPRVNGEFAPLGERAVISGLDDRDQGIQRFKALIKSASR